MPRSTSENLKILQQPDDPSLLDRATTPLWHGPSEAGDWLSHKIDPDHGSKGIRSIASAYAEALGQGVDSLTSPVSLALLGAGGVAASASKAAPYARTALRVAGAASGVHGARNVMQGYDEGDTAKMLGGATEAGLGYLRARYPVEPKAAVKPKVGVAPEVNPGKDFTIEGVPDHTENQPGPRDELRRATLNELREYRAAPDTFEPKRAQALADNLSKRIGTPNAINVAQKIYKSIKDPEFVADVVRPESGHSATLKAEGEPEMSQYLKSELGTETPKREPDVLPETANLGDVGEVGKGKYFTPEEPDQPPPPTKGQGKGKMFGGRTVKGKGGKVRQTKPFQQAPVAETPVAQTAQSGPVAQPPKTQVQDEDALGTVSDPARPYQATDDKNLAQMAKMGSTAAQTEMTLRQKLMSEGGFIDFGGKGPSAPRPPLEESDVTPRSATLTAADEHSPGFARVFEDWVNSRKAAKVEGLLKKREFADLDSEGMEGIHKFQAGLRQGRYQDVQNYFDTKHESLTERGVHAGFKENYLPQLWDNPADEVFEAVRKLGLKPKFTLPSILENYQKGIEVGLKPKFQNISDLVGWYEQTANKAIADRSLFDHLKAGDLIRPKSKAPANGSWASLDADHFPIQKFQSGSKEFQGVLMAPKHISDVVNNYLREPTGKVLGYVADKASVGKNLALSSGVPGTGINAHGFNILARNMMGRGVVKGGLEAARYLISPKTAAADLAEHLDTAPFFMKHGLTLSTEGFKFGESSADTLMSGIHDSKLHPAVEGVMNFVDKYGKKALEFHNKYFEKPLFQDVIPQLKLKHVNELYTDLKSQGLSDTAAARSASQATNNLYGGINWEAMGRNRDTQNLLRALFLAPDWFETNYRLGKGMAQGMRNPNTAEGRIYAGVAKNILAAYASANVVNVATTGHPMWDNAPGHTLDIQVGQSGKQTRWVRPFGTAADFIRLPIDELVATGQGDLGQAFQIGKNRLSLPARAGLDLYSNQNRFGRRIYGKDEYGKPIPTGKQALGIVDEMTSPIMPQYLRNPIDLAAGNLNTEQATVGTLEGPIRYSVAPRVKGRTRSRGRARSR